MKKLCAIAVDDVPVVFDDACLQQLADEGRLPPKADFDLFARGVRDGVRAYAQAARVPSSNDLHREVKALLNAAIRAKYDTVADLLESLSLAARDWVNERGRRPAWLNERGRPPAWKSANSGLVVTLPAAEALRDPARRKAACDLVAQLSTAGGSIIEGRRRPTGKRSRTWRPLPYAPELRRHFPKREAELDLVVSLQITFLRATGRKPALTARHGSAHRSPGPFARMVQKVLRLAGARADAVALINELNRRRREKEKQRSAHDDDELRRSFLHPPGAQGAHPSPLSSNNS